MTGDGSYIFSVPSSVHWMAARYRTPFLQVVFNNGGWRAPRFSTLAVHPDGYASRAARYRLLLRIRRQTMPASPPPPAERTPPASSGPEDLEAAVAEAFRVVREEARAAVLDVRGDGAIFE